MNDLIATGIIFVAPLCIIFAGAGLYLLLLPLVERFVLWTKRGRP